MLKCLVEATGIWWTDAAGGLIEFQAIFGFDLINDKAIDFAAPEDSSLPGRVAGHLNGSAGIMRHDNTRNVRIQLPSIDGRGGSGSLHRIPASFSGTPTG